MELPDGTKLPALADGEYDSIVLGTGLKECIISGASHSQSHPKPFPSPRPPPDLPPEDDTNVFRIRGEAVHFGTSTRRLARASRGAGTTRIENLNY